MLSPNLNIYVGDTITPKYDIVEYGRVIAERGTEYVVKASYDKSLIFCHSKATHYLYQTKGVCSDRSHAFRIVKPAFDVRPYSHYLPFAGKGTTPQNLEVIGIFSDIRAVNVKQPQVTSVTAQRCTDLIDFYKDLRDKLRGVS